MKVVALLASTLASTAAAQSAGALVTMYTYQVKQNGNPLEAKFAEALEKKIKYFEEAGLEIPAHITDTIVSTLASGSTERASDFCPVPDGCQSTISLSQIWSYGCWCMLENPTAGSGNTMDPYDQACRAMSLCNRCAEADDAATGCSAANTGFQVSVEWDADNFRLLMDCSAANPTSTCAEHLCSCEMTFLSKLLDLLWAGTPRSDEFQRNQNFDTALCAGSLDGTTAAPVTDTTTTTTPNPETTVEAPTTEAPLYVCCGLYPERTVMSSASACCEVAGSSVLFNPISQCCSTDGTVGSFGTCT